MGLGVGDFHGNWSMIMYNESLDSTLIHVSILLSPLFGTW